MSLQCFDTVGWAIGRVASGLLPDAIPIAYKLGVGLSMVTI